MVDKQPRVCVLTTMTVQLWHCRPMGRLLTVSLALAAGCNDFANKPIERDKLFATVNKWAKRAKSPPNCHDACRRRYERCLLTIA